MQLSAETFDVRELEVIRPGDVNRHRYARPDELRRLLDEIRPDVLDIHEEPVSVAARQWLGAAAGTVPVVMYTAQNIDKRFPPPFARYERSALSRAQGLYPCSRQAASVARGKGFDGCVEVLPLGLSPGIFTAGEQLLPAPGETVELGLIGRMVAEKGVEDAVRVLAAVRQDRPARLQLVGTGPALVGARRLADRLEVSAWLHVVEWCDADQLAKLYAGMHVVLVPSVATATWVEQFGRVVLEAQACGAVVAGYASGSIPDVADGAGVLVPEGDVDALGTAVRRLLSDGTTFEHLRRAGLANAARATWDDIARRQVRLYADSAAAPAAAARASGPSGRRRLAREEFGPPAAVPGLDRPFALPVLRDLPALSRALGAFIDTLRRSDG